MLDRQTEKLLSRDETYFALLSQEATKCKIAFETFLQFQEKVIVKNTTDDMGAFIAVERYTAWLAHLYEVLKLCVTKELGLPPDDYMGKLAKKMEGENDRVKFKKAADTISAHIESCASRAVSNEGPYLDVSVEFNAGFSECIKKIRDKHFAHPTKKRLSGDIFDIFTKKHYFTALCAYKIYALYWADINGFYGESKDALIKAQDSLASIYKD